MKSLHVLCSMALLSLLLFSCNAQKKVNIAPEKVGKDAKIPVLEWDRKMVELGKIQKGDIREFDYTFTNVSNIPMQLEIVTTCHCTTLEYPSSTKVFKKGESGTIKATFDSSEKEESEKIDITIILANTDAKGYPIIEEVFFSYEF